MRAEHIPEIDDDPIEPWTDLHKRSETTTMSGKINGVITLDVQKALRRSIRGQEATEAVRRLIAALDCGEIVVVDAELFAPPAVAGERMFAFRFHLKAVG